MKIISLYSSKLFLTGEMFLLIIFPLLLIYLYPPIIHARLAVMSAGLFYVYFVAKFLQLTPLNMGFTRINFYESIKSLGIPTLLFIIIIASAYLLAPSTLVTSAVQQEIVDQGIFLSILGYLLISAPVQEIVMRAFLIPRLEQVSQNQYFLIFFSTLIFGTIHLPLDNPWLTVGSYLLGLMWAQNFLRYRNFFALWVSHAAIGGVFINLLSKI